MTYDSKCYDLAETFLDDVGISDPKHINSLAQQIQKTIDEYLEALVPDIAVHLPDTEDL